VKDNKPATRSEKKLAAQKKSTLQQRVGREIAAWFWVGLVFLLVNGAVGQARVIPSGSMQNTLLVGDHLIMSRVGYDAGIPFTNLHVPLWRTPKRQQIVIFRPVIRGEQSDIIKRVIGLPGETVDVRDGGVWINGSRLQENYAVGRTEPADPTQYLAGFEGRSKVFPYTVPRDCFFVMGDNRENSLDSRYTGCIPRENIVGTPVMIYMSIDAPSGPWGSGEIKERALTYLHAAIHPGEVRWRRLFRIF
jgi:signal peptidase I